MKKILKYLDLTEKVICGTGFVILVLLVFFSAILRFFRVSMSWNIDLAMLFLQKIFSLIILVIIFFLTCVICVYGARLVWVERLRMYQSIPVPYSVVTMSLVVATFSMALSTIGKIKKVILSFKNTEETEEAGK